MAQSGFTFDPFPIEGREYAEKVLDLQLASYPIEAKLIGLDAIPPMLDTPETLMSCGEQFLGCFEGERLVGAISYKLIDGGITLDIYRLIVHPDRFRRGIASSLLRRVMSIPGLCRAFVSTGTANTPAVTLYTQHGFTPVRERVIAPGVTATDFEKTI